MALTLLPRSSPAPGPTAGPAAPELGGGPSPPPRPPAVCWESWLGVAEGGSFTSQARAEVTVGKLKHPGLGTVCGGVQGEGRSLVRLCLQSPDVVPYCSPRGRESAHSGLVLAAERRGSEGVTVWEGGAKTPGSPARVS